MSPGIFIAGTDTDIGKTFVAAGILQGLLSQNIDANYFKAVQSGGKWENGQILSGDTFRVMHLAQLSGDYHQLNPYALEPDFSPHLAARLSGVTIERKKILTSFTELSQNHDFIVAEGAGGLIVPLIAHKYHVYDLIRDLNLPVVLVARAGLGTINHTMLSLYFLESLNLPVKGVIINNYTGKGSEDDNIAYIQKQTENRVLGVVSQLNLTGDDADMLRIQNEFKTRIDWNKILN